MGPESASVIPVDNTGPRSQFLGAHAAGSDGARAPRAPPSLDREGGARALDRPPLRLPDRYGRAPHGTPHGEGADVAGAEPSRAGSPRAPLPRVVSAHVASRPHLC